MSSNQQLSAQTSDRISFHDGDLVLYQRAAVWQYQLSLGASKYERRTTGTRNFEKARDIAEKRYYEVQRRRDAGQTVTNVSFDTCADEYCAHLRAKNQARGRRKT